MCLTRGAAGKAEKDEDGSESGCGMNSSFSSTEILSTNLGHGARWPSLAMAAEAIRRLRIVNRVCRLYFLFM